MRLLTEFVLVLAVGLCVSTWISKRRSSVGWGGVLRSVSFVQRLKTVEETAQEDARAILLDTVMQYKARVAERDRSFADFMAKEWPNDSQLFDTGQRSYEEWIALYDSVD